MDIHDDNDPILRPTTGTCMYVDLESISSFVFEIKYFFNHTYIHV